MNTYVLRKEFNVYFFVKITQTLQAQNTLKKYNA